MRVPTSTPRLAAALLLVGLPAAAHAQAFNFTAVSTPVSRTILPALPDGRANGAMLANIARFTLVEGGRATEASGDCSEWLLPPGSAFGAEGVCKLGDASGGRYTLSFNCSATPAGHCDGRLFADGGAFKGRTAKVSYRATPVIEGVGAWDPRALIAQAEATPAGN
ncbi:MAG: hypothetical protein E7812_08250 [Phenylobacterium sp.]|nr:MAG: hypothetical protein E7812_08250 [Phenylobacterium sp.]